MYEPDLYTRANSLQRCGTSDFANEFIDEIGEMSGLCLDIGSGPGDTVVDLILPKLHKEAILVCSDMSETMVNFGKEKYRDNERLSYINLNIEAPDLPENLIKQFNHITSFYCLHWCKKTLQVFENIFNLLRPGGTSFLTFIATTPVYDAYEVLAAMPQYQPYMEDVDRYIPTFNYVERRCEMLEALLKVIGFEIPHCSVRAKNYIFDNVDAFQNFLLALSPFVERMPPDLGKKYIEDLANEIIRRNIIINNVNNNEHEHGHRVPCIYYSFVVYLRKPVTD